MSLRHYYNSKIIAQIEPGAKVLDLGCGKGDLLATLSEEKSVNGYGIDINFDNVVSCVEKGLSVYQGDIEEGLKEFSDNSFDYVILSQTLQEVYHPLTVLTEMIRVGKKGIVTFPNFGHWQIRLNLLIYGRSPKTATLPYEWYDTPNIRVLSINDFRRLCELKNIEIDREVPIYPQMPFGSVLAKSFSNLFSKGGLFVIRRR